MQLLSHQQQQVQHFTRPLARFDYIVLYIFNSISFLLHAVKMKEYNMHSCFFRPNCGGPASFCPDYYNYKSGVMWNWRKFLLNYSW